MVDAGLQRLLRDLGQILQRGDLLGGQCSVLSIHDAQRGQDMTFDGDRQAGVKLPVRRGVVGLIDVEGVCSHGAGAPGAFAAGMAALQAMSGQRIQPVGVDQVDGRSRATGLAGSQSDQGLQGGWRLGIQPFRQAQQGQSLALVCLGGARGRRGLHWGFMRGVDRRTLSHETDQYEGFTTGVAYRRNSRPQTRSVARLDRLAVSPA